jgi:ACS family hexuronate transporter-like MFS transporter
MNRPTNVRWTIVALLFFATTINYIDRQVIGLLKPFIQDDLHWNEADYGYIVSAFQFAYAIGLLLSGRLLDRLGTRLGYTLSILLWSVAATLHAFMRTVTGFGFARALLGLGESGNFPAAVKTIAEWFPKRDRALATGLFNAGSTIGAIVAPVIVAGITLRFGWKWAFVVTGCLGFIWLLFWLLMYARPERHKGVNAAELAYIRSGDESFDPESTSASESASASHAALISDASCTSTKPDAPLGWANLLRHRQTWAICAARLVTDWVWWFFLFWMPDYLNKTQQMDIKATVLPIVVIYTMASFGGILGGWISSGFIRSGRSIDFARKNTILLCALLVLPLMLLSRLHDLWPIVLLIGLAAAAHQGWASNIYTIVSDIYPKNVVGTVIGMSGFGGAVFGAFSASFVGLTLQWTGSYTLIFSLAGSMYLLAWILLKVFIKRIEPITLGQNGA